MRVYSAPLLLAVLASGCTFYTCPNTQCGDTPANNAQAGANGQGGNGNQGGAGATGPAPTGSWVSVTNNLTTLKSQCGNMSYLSAKPDEDLLIAGIALDGLWASSDGGQNWSAMGVSAKSATIINRASSILYDPTDTQTFWETGIYNGGGVYITTDDGVTFSPVGDIMHDDYLSVDFADSKRRTMIASGHEADHLLHLSTNGGDTWTDISAHEPDGAGACSFPLLIDPKTFLLGCRSYGGASGIYRSTNAGLKWDQVSTAGGAAAPLLTTDNSLYFASDFGAGLVTSDDQGQHWTALGPVGVVDSSVAPIQLPDYRLASVSGKKVVVSADSGNTWQVVSVELPFNPVGLVYSQYQKAFFVWHFSCDDSSVTLPDDAILRYDFDYTTQ